MFKKLLAQILSAILGSGLSQATVKEFLIRIGYRMVDLGVAWLVAWIWTLLNTPDPDLPLLSLGNTPDQVYQGVSVGVVMFIVSTLLRYGWPIIRQLLGLCVIGTMFIAGDLQAASVEGPSQFQYLGVFRADIGERSAALFFVSPDTATVEKRGREAFVAGPPGRYRLKMVEVIPPKDDQSPIDTLEVSKTFDIVSSPDPSPVPPPIPPPTPPTPPQPLPDGQYRLAAWAYAEAMKLPVSDKARSTQIAGELKALSSALAAGGIKTPNELMVATRDMLNAQGWTVFRAALAAQIKSLGFASKGSQEFVVAWNEIATGLESVK